jgi:uncharacterized protein
MTDEERDLIARFIARVGGQPQGGGAFGSSVPATTQPLPPIDPEADRFIGENLTRYPEARYRITQMAVVQEAALAEAQNRIKRLEWELQQTQAQLQQASQQSAQAPRGGGLFGGLFGGGQRQAPPPQQGYGQQPGYAPQAPYGGPQMQPPPPGYQPGMFQRQGSGFLGSALTTAAGVAGGLVAGNALMDLFGGHGGGGGGFGGGQGGETIVNNYGDAASPWGAGAGGAGGDPFAGQGTDVDPNFGNAPDAGGFDDGGGGFDSGGGGWDDNNSF